MSVEHAPKPPYLITAVQFLVFSAVIFAVLSVPRLFDLHALEVVGSAALVLASLAVLTVTVARAKASAQNVGNPLTQETTLTMVLPLLGSLYLLRVALG